MPRGLRSWPPSKGVPKPWPGKVPKKCFGECQSETGCRGKCSGLRAYVEVVLETEPGALFSAFSPAPRFGQHSPKHFFGTFPGQTFSTPLDGGQERNSRPFSTRNCLSKHFPPTRGGLLFLSLPLFEGATEPLRPDDPHPHIPLTPTRFGPPF